MTISEIITDKYKLRMPPTVYYDLLADVIEAEEEQEQKMGEWLCSDDMYEQAVCSLCKEDAGEPFEYTKKRFKYCPNCGAKMSENPTGSNCTTCILDGTDACSRGAGRAVNDEPCEDFIGEESEE